MEQINQENSLFELSIDETSKDHLKKIASWALVIVVCAVIGYIFTIIKAAQPRNPFPASEGFGVGVTGGSGIGGAILGILIGLLVNYFLFQFANRIRKGVSGMSQNDLNAGFYNLKIYFAIVGILVIIVVVIAMLAILLVGTNPGIR
jgi:multisubunit Na+/H+ antiporter MnhB subunit